MLLSFSVVSNRFILNFGYDECRSYRYYVSPVMLSTMPDGKIVRGLAGVPNEGPVLLVGYHMLLGTELVPLALEFLREKKVLIRGLTHPTLFSQQAASSSNEFSFFDLLKVFGALPVTPSNLFKLFSTKSHGLLYPGGAREALHRKVCQNLWVLKYCFSKKFSASIIALIILAYICRCFLTYTIHQDVIVLTLL